MTAIEVRGLHKRYGAAVAVDQLDLSVPEGAVFGLLGPNGAGKSTTFGVICGWLRPTRGNATVLGVPSDRLHTLRGQVATLPQDATFPEAIPIGVQIAHYGRLMGLGAAEAKSAAQRALQAVGLSDAANKRGRELSHGMAKRAGIAQCLVGDPKVVLLDEPTAGLDPANARAVREIIGSLAPRATVVVSSHNLSEIQDICTHGAILDHGKLTATGTIAELTRTGSEIVVTCRPGAAIPVGPLNAAFGEDAVDHDASGVVRVRFPGGVDPADVIGRTLRILLDAQVPILGVSQGTSLESAFLELTRDPATR